MKIYQETILCLLINICLLVDSICGQTIQFFKSSNDPEISESYQRKSNFYIQGRFQGMDSGKIILSSGSKAIDTAVFKNGKLELVGECDFPQLISLRVLGDYYEYTFFLEHANLDLSLNISDHEFLVKGGKENDMRNEFNNINKPLIQQWSHFSDQISIAEGAADLSNYLNYIDSISKIENIFFKHIEQQISKGIIGYYLLSSINAVFISYGYFKKRLSLFNSLPDSIKNSLFGKKVYKVINDEQQKREKLIHEKAFEFELSDTLSNFYSLKRFKGKYVLIDFWASWCVPCIKELPLLRNIYSVSDTKKIVFLSISIDKTRDAWKKAMGKYNIPWLSLLADPKTIQEYNINSIPNKILIDPNGHVIASYLTPAGVYDNIKNLQRNN